MEKIIKIEMKLRGTEKEIEDIKARIVALTFFETVISWHIKKF